MSLAESSTWCVPLDGVRWQLVAVLVEPCLLLAAVLDVFLFQYPCADPVGIAFRYIVVLSEHLTGRNDVAGAVEGGGFESLVTDADKALQPNADA